MKRKATDDARVVRGTSSTADKADKKPTKLKVKIMTPTGPMKPETPVVNKGGRPKDPVSTSYTNPK